MLSHGTSTKANKLRKNEPHPMSLFAPMGKLVDNLTKNLVLSVQEANEVGNPLFRWLIQVTHFLNVIVSPSRLALPHLRHLSLLMNWAVGAPGFSPKRASSRLESRTRACS